LIKKLFFGIEYLLQDEAAINEKEMKKTKPNLVKGGIHEKEK
jgi:hypothetical protein